MHLGQTSYMQFLAETREVKPGQKETQNYVRFEVFTAVTMKDVVFWDIRTQFVPHRKHFTTATEPSRLMICKI
jgi:hypothetical protein